MCGHHIPHANHLGKTKLSIKKIYKNMFKESIGLLLDSVYEGDI